MTFQAVLFDIGGVLFRWDDMSLWRKWGARFGLTERQLGKIIFDNPVAAQANVGQAKVEEVWREVGDRLGLQPDELDALQVDIWGSGVWDTELLDFIRSLRPHYRTGTISDAWPGAREITQAYVNSAVFDVSVFSSEEGLTKPDPEIYKRALSRLSVAFSEAIFIDDRRKNVEGARQVGMHAIRFTGSLEIREEITRLIHVDKAV